MSNITAYPLTWPQAFSRSKQQEKGQFRTTLNGALKNVDDSLRKFADDSGSRSAASTQGEAGIRRVSAPVCGGRTRLMLIVVPVALFLFALLRSWEP